MRIELAGREPASGAARLVLLGQRQGRGAQRFRDDVSGCLRVIKKLQSAYVQALALGVNRRR